MSEVEQTPKKKSISTGWNITILIFSVIGALINLSMLGRMAHDMRGEYDNYLDNLDIYADSNDKYMIFMRLFHYNIARFCLGALIFTAVFLVLLAIIKRRSILFSLYGIAASAGSVYVVTLTKMAEYKDDFGMLPAIGLATGTVVAMGMMIIGVWSKRASLVWLALPVMIGTAFLITQVDTYLSYGLYLADFVAVIFLAAFYVHGMKAANKVKAPKPVPAVQPAAAPVAAPAAPAAVPAPEGAQADGSPAGEAVSVVAAGDLFAYDNIIVDQKVRMFKFGNAYGLYDVDGNVIGNVTQENISGGAKAAQLMLGKNMKSVQSFTLVIYDGSGARVGGVSRKGMGYVNIEDAAGNSIGIMKRGKLVTESGEVLASVKTASLSKLNILGPDGQVIGSLNRKWNGLVKTALTWADKYLVIFEPGTSASQRAMVLGLCMGFEMLTD